MPIKTAQTVSATQLVRDLAAIRTMTAQGPVGITSHGRTELVVLNALRFAELNAATGTADVETLEAKLSIVLDSIETHVAIVDHDLRVLRINRSMRISLKMPEGSHRGRFIHDLLPIHRAPMIIRRLAEVHQSGRIAEFDFESGMYPGRMLHARMVPWPGGIAYLSDDITDRLASIERDTELNAFRAASFALTGRGGAIVGERGEVIKADIGFSEMIGAPVDQIEGRKFVPLFTHSAQARVEAALDWREGRQSLLEVGYVRPGREPGTARLSLVPFASRDGELRYAVILADIVQP